jgi:putative colanic acid biosynthesis acetyltransferase WcaF
VLWGFGRVLFRLVPRPLYGIRRLMLRCFGAKVGRAVQISNTAIVYFPWQLAIGDDSSIGDHAYVYNLGPLEIGRRVTVSQRAHLCGGSHDYQDPAMPLIRARISIEDDAWVCADAFVGPGVTIAKGCVVGARSVVVQSTTEWTVVAGNPARLIKERVLNGRDPAGVES